MNCIEILDFYSGAPTIYLSYFYMKTAPPINTFDFLKYQNFDSL